MFKHWFNLLIVSKMYLLFLYDLVFINFIFFAEAALTGAVILQEYIYFCCSILPSIFSWTHEKIFFPNDFFVFGVCLSFKKIIFYYLFIFKIGYWYISSGWPCPHSPALALKVFATIPSSFSCLESWRGELLLSLLSLADEKVSYDHTRMNTLGRCREWVNLPLPYRC